MSDARHLIGPAGVIRQCVADDTWPFTIAADDQGTDTVSLPHEARCKLCEAPPVEPGETDPAYTLRLREEGIAFGPATRGSCERWLDKHLRQEHGLPGITGSYKVKLGAEQWV